MGVCTVPRAVQAKDPWNNNGNHVSLRSAVAAQGKARVWHGQRLVTEPSKTLVNNPSKNLVKEPGKKSGKNLVFFSLLNLVFLDFPVSHHVGIPAFRFSNMVKSVEPGKTSKHLVKDLVKPGRNLVKTW